MQEGTKLANCGLPAVQFDLFSKDIVLIPINHKNVHWAVAVINFRLKRIEYYDSMLMTDNGDVFAVCAHHCLISVNMSNCAVGSERLP